MSTYEIIMICFGITGLVMLHTLCHNLQLLIDHRMPEREQVAALTEAVKTYLWRQRNSP